MLKAFLEKRHSRSYSLLKSSFVFIFAALILGTQLYAEEAEDLEIENTEDEGAKIGVHGIVDVSFLNDYITPRGLLATNTDLTVQVLSIQFFDFYSNPDACFLNKASILGGIWADMWTGQDNRFIGSFHEFDWFVGFSFHFAKHWVFDIQFVQFLSPPYDFRPENNMEFLLVYHDAHLGHPVAINPYVRWFWAVSGDSTVVTGRRGKTFDVELGIVPTIDLSKYFCNFHLLIKAPTWLTVGPANFWNGGELALKNEKSNFGVFTTGLKLELPLKMLKDRIGGEWYTYLEGRYYYLINKNLLQAQLHTLHLSSINSAHRDIGVISAGFGVTY